jgi:hypothetical protein
MTLIRTESEAHAFFSVQKYVVLKLQINPVYKQKIWLGSIDTVNETDKWK